MSDGGVKVQSWTWAWQLTIKWRNEHWMSRNIRTNDPLDNMWGIFFRVQQSFLIQIEGINQRTIQKLVFTSWSPDFWRVLRNPALLILAKSWEKSFIEYCRSRRTLQRTFSLIFNISQSKNSNLWWCRCDLSLIRSCFLVISLVFSANNVPDIPADVTGQPRP